MNPFKKSCIIAAVYLLALSAFLLSLYFSGKTNQGYVIVILIVGFAIAVIAICDIYEKEIMQREQTLSHSSDIEEYCIQSVASFAQKASSRSCNITAALNVANGSTSTRNLITEYREMMECERDGLVNGIEHVARSFSFERDKHYEKYLKKKKEYLQKSLDEILNKSLQAIYEAQQGIGRGVS